MRSKGAKSSAPDLPDDLDRIRSLNTNELRLRWFEMTRKRPTRQLSGDLLRRMVMHHVQEQRLGGLDRQTARMLDRLADGRGVVPVRLKIGTVLVREHEDTMHQVMVVEGGFAWNDRVLPSLSAAAKAITGTTWNGNRFFGLRKAALDREPPSGERSRGAAAVLRRPSRPARRTHEAASAEASSLCDLHAQVDRA